MTALWSFLFRLLARARSGGVAVFRGHVAFYIGPGVADEGAGGAPKGLSVSGHVLGEVVLKGVLT